jgi:DNA-directed RNA polymerase subunit RPC12/RpoP
VKIAWRESDYPCQNCGREFPGSKLDRRLWCQECRRVVVRRATWVGQTVGVVAALSLGAYVFSVVGSSPRFMMAYLIMIAAAYFFLYKLTQRVAFEIIRGRGVPPPVTEDEEDSANG